jgi:uncharacterized protein YjiS (DUF1127 family)
MHPTTELFEPKGATRFMPDATANARSTPTARTRAQIEAWAKHAAAANGFGDAGNVMPTTESVPAAVPARESTLQRLWNLATRFFAAWADYRRRRAEHEILARLDATMLRDLGIDRSEIGSVLTESNGSSPPTRRRVVASHREVFESPRLRIKNIDRFL